MEFTVAQPATEPDRLRSTCRSKEHKAIATTHVVTSRLDGTHGDAGSSRSRCDG